MPPRYRPANRYTVLSSDAAEPDEPDNPTSYNADLMLPPSDPPEPDSGSNSESEMQTPIPRLPALLPFLRAAVDAVSPPSSSPLQRGRRIHLAPPSEPESPPRRSSEPPMESPRVIVQDPEEHVTSDDIMWTPRREKQILTQRAQLKRMETLAAIRAQKEAALEAERVWLEAEELARQAARNAMFDKFLKEMQTQNASVADFMDYVFNPENKFDTDWRWSGFFLRRPLVERIFGYWTTSKYNASTRAFIDDWAKQHVAKKVYTEAGSITNSGILSKAKKIVNEQFFLDFNLAQLTQTLRAMAPFAFAIFDAFSTTTRQLKQRTAAFLERKKIMNGTAALTLLRARSQKNNYPQAVTGTYLAATGGQRQHYSVLSLYGFSMGYTSIISRSTPKPSGVAVEEATEANAAASEPLVDNSTDTSDDGSGDDLPALDGPRKRKKNKGKSTRPKKKSKKKRKRRVHSPGLLSFLRDACMETTRNLAASRLALIVYDNVNLMNRIAEQILGRKSVQENGTCTTLIPLHNAKLVHLLTSELDKSILAARPLTIDDISLNPAETEFFIENMVHTILRIIVLHGGEGFQKWKEDLDASQPMSADIIDVHQTPLHPLPSMEIDQSSTTGNVEVIEEIMRVLGFKRDDPDYAKYIQLIAGDQLTIARQRSILNARLGHESGANSWRHIVPVPGLFHAKIADCHGVLETHFGKPTFRSPGSLGFHNTVLDRLPITLTSLPPFRTCRDLIMVSLYARVLHCLLLVSGKDSLEACAESITSYDTLVTYAKRIYSTYADADRVQELRERRIPEERKRDAEAKAAKKSGKAGESSTSNLPHVCKGDMVLENGILFLRDALLTREFADAIKAGDSGRVLVILRMWAFCYRGNGRTKYAHEMLHLLHNLICVWTKELRYIVLQNWLANPQGKVKTFVEIDLVQEHLNFWIKKIYKADGAGHSWDWLSLISPCVDILRQLATKINVDLGARQGSKHATPNLEEDIDALMDSLAEHEVYVEKEGRVLDDDEKPAPDVLSVGMATLTHGSSTTPLSEFNQQLKIMRERRGLAPVSDFLPLIDVSGDAASTSVMTAAITSTNTSADPDIANSDLPPLVAPDDSDEEPEDDDPEPVEEDEDLFSESPTLTRFDEGDVELDMDDVPEWYLDENESESDSDEDEA